MAKTTKNDTPEATEETQGPPPEESTVTEKAQEAATETGGGLVDSDGHPVIPADGRGLPWPNETSGHPDFLTEVKKAQTGKFRQAAELVHISENGRPSRLEVAARLLCSIIQLPAYSDIYKGVGDSGLQDGAVALSLIMADKLMAAESRS